MEMKKYSFRVIVPSDVEWEQIESSYDSTVYQTKSWARYVDRIGYRQFCLEICERGNRIGFFIGEKLWRGVYVVAAPFEGIGTYTQGLAMLHTITYEERVEIYRQMADYIFHERIASLFQVDDWQLREDSDSWDEERSKVNPILARLSIRHEVRPTLYTSLNKPIEALWAQLHYKSCKYCINKARKLGLEVQQILKKEEIPGFIDVHYNQLKEVCHRKGMKPKAGQGKDRMLALCESLFPDRVIMVKVVGKDEHGISQIMSSGIFCIDKGECCYWTGASFQRYQKYCPNEIMVWEAMRILNERGAGDLNFCGMAKYKLKFGTIYAFVPRLIFTRYEIIYDLKNLAKKMYHKSRKLLHSNR